MGVFEVIFDISYLVLVLSFGLVLLVQNNKNAIIFAWMAIILGIGDSFHLLPRIISYLSPQGFGGHLWALSWGKMVTSVTMTFFYLLYYFYYRRVSGDYDKRKMYILISLALMRIGLSLMPQNGWGSGEESYAFAIYRNIPFALMGLMLIVWSYKNKSLPELKAMWILISLSFIFYLPVVLFADRYPLVGALMIPKTLAYLFIVIRGLRTYMPKFTRKNLLDISFSSLVMGLGLGAFYREFTKFYNFTGPGHLSKVHPHILILGFVFSLFLYLISKGYGLASIKKLGGNIKIYLTGLYLSLISMLAIGLWEVVGSLNSNYLRAFQAIGGLGHIIIAFAMVRIVLLLIKNDQEREAHNELSYKEA